MIVIIGAGVSGLTVARELGAEREWVVLEKEPVPGGLATQYEAGGYWFDYAGHYFHFKDKEAVHRLVEKVCSFREFNRKSKTYVADRYVPFPVQFHLSYLPAVLRSRILAEIETAAPLPAKGSNLGDFLETNFGKTLFDLFFDPFLGKYYGSDLHDILADMDKGSIPPPDKERITAGARGKRFFNAGYNPVFYYPEVALRGFIIRYADLPGSRHMHFNQTVTAVDIHKRRVRTASGEYEYDKLVTSMPLNRLLAMITPNDGFPAPGELHHVSTLLVNVVLKKKRKRFHWVYVADRDIPFYRAGFYPAHPYPACYLERSLPPGTTRLDKDQVRQETVYTLQKLGCIESSDEIEFLDARIIPVSYILFTKNWRDVVPPLLKKLESHGIYSIGRYGSWNYTSMSDDIKGALQCAGEL